MSNFDIELFIRATNVTLTPKHLDRGRETRKSKNFGVTDEKVMKILMIAISNTIRSKKYTICKKAYWIIINERPGLRAGSIKDLETNDIYSRNENIGDSGKVVGSDSDLILSVLKIPSICHVLSSSSL